MEKGNDIVNVDKTHQRHSVMSLEPQLSPISSSGEEHESIYEYPSEELRPHLSHASSAAAIGGIIPSLRRSYSHRSGKSVATTATSTDPAFEVDFTEDDAENPQNWSLLRKCFIVGAFSYVTTTVVIWSTSYASAIPGMQAEWAIDEVIGVLGITFYMVGVAIGALVVAPFSEMLGRRIVYIVSGGLFIVFVVPCAIARNIETLLVFRFLAAFCGSAFVSNSPGTVNDIVDERHRAFAFSIWSVGPINGPVLGPVVGGFIYEYLPSWRFESFVAIGLAGLGFLLIAPINETYAPVILRRKAARIRKETGDDRYWSRYDEKVTFWELLRINLSRPLRLAVQETILLQWNCYVGVVYGILYMCFIAYPIVFNDVRGWSPGLGGLAFCGIGLGSTIVIASEPLIRRYIDSHPPDPETGEPAPEAMVSVICLCSILLPVGELIFAWTCTPNVHFIVPILAGIPFGAGACGVFIYASTYLVQSYGIYAASALAGNAVVRSIMGATLPLAAPSLYKRLGPGWAGTLLALLLAMCVPIPFIFYKYGGRIRMKSRLIRQMQEDRRRLDAKRSKAEKTIIRRAQGEAMAGNVATGSAAINEGMDLEKSAESSKSHTHQHSSILVGDAKHSPAAPRRGSFDV